MAQSNGEATLDDYIYDHLVRKKLHNTANSLMTEGRVSPDPAAIDTPGGLLFAWWSMFRDIYNAKTKEKQAVEYELNVYIYDYLVKKELHNTAMTFVCEVKVSPDHVAVDTPGGFLLAWWSVFWAFFNAEAQQGKEKEQMKQPNPWNTETFQPHMDAGRIDHGQMVHGQQGGVLSALKQLQSRTQQTPENKSEVNLWASPRQLPVDPSTVYGQGLLQSKPGMGNTGLNPGIGAHSLKGWPFTGIDNMRQGLGPQVQKAFLQNQGQFELSPQQQQQQEIMAQVQGQGNMTSSLMYGDMDPRRFTGFPRGNLNSKDGQQNANNDGSMLSNSSKLINMPPVQQSSSQQQDPLLSQQNNGTMQHVNDMPKGPMMYGYDEIGGLPSSANQLPQPNPMNTETFQPHMDPRMALPESGTTYHGEMVQGNHQGGDVSDSVLETREDDASKTPASARHIRRCNCKKSNCRKGYCACFQGQVGCSTDCRCEGCENPCGVVKLL